MWAFSGKQHQFERTTDLRLGWEVQGDPITDDYTPSEVSAYELWSMWRGQNLGDRLAIRWMVRGDGVAELAPFLPRGGLEQDFLTFYTWPVDADGERLRWTDLAIEDKLWNSERADKGGFIQEYSGWKPSPFQQEMDVTLLERVLNHRDAGLS
jgi:hypothetical protein